MHGKRERGDFDEVRFTSRKIFIYETEDAPNHTKDWKKPTQPNSWAATGEASEKEHTELSLSQGPASCADRSGALEAYEEDPNSVPLLQIKKRKAVGADTTDSARKTAAYLGSASPPPFSAQHASPVSPRLP